MNYNAFGSGMLWKLIDSELDVFKIRSRYYMYFPAFWNLGEIFHRLVTEGDNSGALPWNDAVFVPGYFLSVMNVN